MSFVIAEIGTSHQGSIEKAKQLVDCAAEAGADAVKFQWVYAREILHPKTGFVTLPAGNVPLYQRFEELECSVDFYTAMLDYAHQKKVKFICSPFGLQSLQELLSIGPDAVKIASPELNHYPMLKALADFRKKQKEAGGKMVDLIVSSGVSTLSDIEKALDILGKEGVTLLHCITSYPAPEEEYNLSLIKNLSSIFGVPCGVSDHSLDPVLVPSLSVALGGTMIEKHITISRRTSGLDDPVALEGEQFALMVHCVHQTQSCMNRYGIEKGLQVAISQLSESYGYQKVMDCIGNGKKTLAPAEKANYGRTNRSLHYMKSLKKGHKVCESDVSVLRTEKVLSVGIGPEFLDYVEGAVLSKDVEDGDGVQFHDFFVREE